MGFVCSDYGFCTVCEGLHKEEKIIIEETNIQRRALHEPKLKSMHVCEHELQYKSGKLVFGR